MANSTLSARPNKPRGDFPLFPHRNGRWAKKIRGRFVYFGKWSDDQDGERAVNQWLDQKDDLLAGRTPRGSREGLTVGELVNTFLTSKEAARDAGEITGRTFADYLDAGKIVADSFGKNRLAVDLASDDFEALRKSLAKVYGVHRLGNVVGRIRTVFKYGHEAGLLEHATRFGPAFKKPPARIVRAHRQKTGARLFEATDLRAIIDKADHPLRAMILLGVNAGFGNHDCGTLPIKAIDLDGGWVNYPRPKTAVARRCPLWPETIKALRQAIDKRPAPKSPEHRGLVFVTKYGAAWAKGTSTNPISAEMRKLLDDLDLYRPGLSFYTLRHVFETIASGSRDQVAVNSIMGHVDQSMAGAYRETIDDARLLDVTNHVRKWLFPKRKTK